MFLSSVPFNHGFSRHTGLFSLLPFFFFLSAHQECNGQDRGTHAANENTATTWAQDWQEEEEEEKEWVWTSSPPHHQRVGLSRPVRCQSWGPIRGKKKKKQPSLLEKIRPLTSENNNPTRSDGETISRVLLRVRRRWPGVPTWSRFYTLMSAFTDIKRECRRPPRDPPVPPCLLLSAFIWGWYGQTDWQISITALSVKFSLQVWEVITGLGPSWCSLCACMCARLGFFLSHLSDRARRAAPIFFGSNVSNRLQKRDIFKKTPRQTGRQAVRRAVQHRK